MYEQNDIAIRPSTVPDVKIMRYGTRAGSVTAAAVASPVPGAPSGPSPPSVSHSTSHSRPTAARTRNAVCQE
nr:hypothetical protein [Actinomadura sp. J1-007]